MGLNSSFKSTAAAGAIIFSTLGATQADAQVITDPSVTHIITHDFTIVAVHSNLTGIDLYDTGTFTWQINANAPDLRPDTNDIFGASAAMRDANGTFGGVSGDKYTFDGFGEGTSIIVINEGSNDSVRLTETGLTSHPDGVISFDFTLGGPDFDTITLAETLATDPALYDDSVFSADFGIYNFVAMPTNITITAIPEPAEVGMILGGAATSLLLLRRRRGHDADASPAHNPEPTT